VSAPLVFVLVPLAASVLAYVFFPVRPRLVILLSALFAALMARIASVLPLDAPFTVLQFTVPVSSSFSLLGRPFVFDPDMRSALVFLFVGGGSLFAGSFAVPPNRFLLPVGWIVLGLFSSSLFVRPFLFAAFFLFLSVLCLSLLLSDPSHPVPRGSVRWIVCSALGMLFLLLAGSELSLLDNLPTDPEALQSLLLRLCLGFGLLLSFPPFHFWLPDVVDDSSPYNVSFILSLYIGAVIFFLLRFLDGFAWLRQAPETYVVLQVAGVGMCAVGAAFSVFQERLGRSVGYLSLCNLGAILLSLSVGGSSGVQMALVLLASRGVSLLVWGVSFHALRPKQAGDRPEDLRGAAFSRPLAFAAALLSGLSLVGTPGLIAFPPFWALLRSLASAPDSILPVLSLLLSLSAGVLSIFRFARPMLSSAASLPSPVEKGRLLRLFLLGAILSLFLLGLFPQLYIPLVANAANAFANLSVSGP
jgi:formate hydrogenlyase subunit 3/multisubunit Na+/H+ antiporter MnhD subunit